MNWSDLPSVGGIAAVVLLLLPGDGRSQNPLIQLKESVPTKIAAPLSSDAIESLCDLLGDRLYHHRSVAIEKLFANGDGSVNPLRRLLNDKSSRKRAAATEALGRMDRLTLDELAQLSRDTDARVRAATAGPLSRLGEPAVSLLIALIADPEAAVGTQAAQSLTLNQTKSADAIEALTDALARNGVGWAAADALTAYGVEAQRAIPAIIENIPFGPAARHSYFDMGEKALRHIGPPNELDVPRLCECLKLKSVDAKRLAVDELSMLGRRAQESAAALEDSAKASMGEYLRLMSVVDFAVEDARRRDSISAHLRFADHCLHALWFVTEDADRFLQFTVELALQADRPLYGSLHDAWERLPQSACPRVEQLLNHENKNLKLVALGGVKAMRNRSLPLLNTVLKLESSDDAQISQAAFEALLFMGDDAREWPLNPIHLVNDIPFMVGEFIAGEGRPEHPAAHIDWAQRFGVIRDEPLVPTRDPYFSAEELLNSPEFARVVAFRRSSTIERIRLQAFTMVPEFHPNVATRRELDRFVEPNWEKLVKRAIERKLHWDSTKEAFVTD